jgi:hypothetical protein
MSIKYFTTADGKPLGAFVDNAIPPEGAIEVWELPPYIPTIEERIFELKKLLRDTDYVALSDYDKIKPEVLSQRQAWREEIRTLETS